MHTGTDRFQRKPNVMNDKKLQWCDPACPHASFPRKEHLDGACHTFIALYCSKYKRLVQKSGPCLDLEGDPPDE